MFFTLERFPFTLSRTIFTCEKDFNDDAKVFFERKRIIFARVICFFAALFGRVGRRFLVFSVNAASQTRGLFGERRAFP